MFLVLLCALIVLELVVSFTSTRANVRPSSSMRKSVPPLYVSTSKNSMHNNAPVYEDFVEMEIDLSQDEDEDDDDDFYDEDLYQLDLTPDELKQLKTRDAELDMEMLGIDDNLDLDVGMETIEIDPSDMSKNIGKNRVVYNDQEWMFFDVARINVKGGDGGNGCMAMRREFRVEFGGPSGGNGGNGGSVYLECDKDLNTLSLLRRRVHHKGKPGTNGLGDSRHGHKGDDCIIPVPPGTIVRDQHGVLAGELNIHKQRLLVAKGGTGGRGNEHFKTARRNAPAFAEKGAVGSSRWLNIELKLLADVGFIGVPNAGKSTLLGACSNAKPKIADYAFTTVVPNLGVCDLFDQRYEKGDAKSLVLADIPGLLEGAHDGKGLGLAFLRHVDRCRVLVHVIKGDSFDPIGDFIAINQELKLFNPRLADRTQVVVINKVDLPEVRELLPDMISEIKRLAGHTRIVGISAATGENVKMVMERVTKLIESMPNQSEFELFSDDEKRVDFDEVDNGRFTIISDENYPGQYRVQGVRIEKIVEQTNWDYYEAVQRFQRILDAVGISQALRKKGARQGDLIMIGELDFNFWEKKNRWVQELGLEDLNPRWRGENTIRAR